MFGLSQWELLIILVIALLLFGHKLPAMMRGMGSSVKEFKKGMKEEETATPVRVVLAQPSALVSAADHDGTIQAQPKA